MYIWYYFTGGGCMSISKDKVRTQLTIEKELKKTLETMAKNEERSFNNLIIKVLKDYVSSHK